MLSRKNKRKDDGEGEEEEEEEEIIEEEMEMQDELNRVWTGQELGQRENNGNIQEPFEVLEENVLNEIPDHEVLMYSSDQIKKRRSKLEPATSKRMRAEQVLNNDSPTMHRTKNKGKGKAYIYDTYVVFKP